MKLTPRLKRALIMLSSASLLLAFGALASGETSDALLRRYPYDPACPWGRINNGKGVIVRCLSEAEAQGLRSGAIASPSSSALPVASAVPLVAPPPLASATPTTVATEEVTDADAGAPALAPSNDKLE